MSILFDDYLAKLQLVPPEQPNLAFLNQFITRHIASFSFNSVYSVLGKTMPLELDELLEKVVNQGMGGYCFEHNKIVFEFLSSLGYSTRLVVARVLNNQDRSAPRTHRFTVVELNQKSYLVDVGFGAACPITAIEFGEVWQRSGLDRYFIREIENREFELVVEKEGGPFVLYRFDLANYSEADCQVGHFYSHQHPDAVFVNNLVVSQKSANEVCVLTNETLLTRSASQQTEQIMDTADKLHQVLTQLFKLNIEEDESRHLFERCIATKL